MAALRARSARKRLDREMSSRHLYKLLPMDVSKAVKSFDGKPFMRLLNAAEPMPANASRTYLEIERE